MTKADSVDEYIASYDSDQQKVLTQLRASLRKAIPDAVELMSYGMPALKTERVLLWYAAQGKHYGLYPKAATVAHFADELRTYECSKGTIRFPRGQKLPVELITRIAKFCVENDMRVSIKKASLKKATAKKTTVKKATAKKASLKKSSVKKTSIKKASIK